MSAKNDIVYLNQVIKNGLCTRCGSCVGLSSGHARFTNKEGEYLPEFEVPITAEVASRMQSGCSAAEVCFPEMNRFVFSSEAVHPYIGHFKNVGISHSLDKTFRSMGASGGILSHILIWLLRKGEIQGAVVTGMDKQQPWQANTYIARTDTEILAAAQSKYIITSPNEMLPEIATFEGNLAYVGLPCQVHSIRKLQMANDASVKKIKYVFGPFCGNTLHFSSIKGLLRSYGEKDHTTIKHLSFREGEWPGSTRIDLESGRQILIEKFHANYLIPFHIMKRCLLCTDLANEFTDLSGGDAWAPIYEERGKGFSLVVARSNQGKRILNEMIADRALTFDEISAEDAVVMHSHGYDLKKRGAFIRIRYRKMTGREIPNYGYHIKGMKLPRYMMELVIDAMFAIASTSLARAVVVRIKPETMGAIFKRLRTAWKKATHKTKRSNLVEG